MMKTKELLKGVDLQRLVGLVRSAVKSQAGKMILDLELYDEDGPERIEPMLTDELELGNTEEDAVKSAVSKLFDWHEERMCDAARDDAAMAKRRALDHLANDPSHAPR